MDSQQEYLLHTEVRWLSQGRVLSRIVELKEKTKQFSRERNSCISGISFG